MILVLRYLSMKKQYKLPESAWGDQGHPTDSLVDTEGFVQRLARMIQIPTLSWTNRSKRDISLISQFQLAFQMESAEILLARGRHRHWTPGPGGGVSGWRKNPSPAGFNPSSDTCRVGPVN